RLDVCPNCDMPAPEDTDTCLLCGTELRDAAPDHVAEDAGPDAALLEQVVVPPTLRERYELVEERSTSGGEAQRFLMRPREGGDLLLLKVYGLGRTRVDDRALEEIQQSAREHVVEVFGFGTWRDRRWELLEYCDHGSLRDLIDRHDGGMPGD